MTDLSKKLSDIRAIAERASEGPWRKKGVHVYNSRGLVASGAKIYPSSGDAEFIAASRDLVPSLVAALEKAVADLERIANRAYINEASTGIYGPSYPDIAKSALQEIEKELCR